MYLEWWMIATLGGVFLAGMISTGRAAFRDGVNQGAQGTLLMLEDEGFLKCRMEVVDGEETEVLMKPIAFEES